MTAGASRAVLVSPTDNRVLNQIPAGDGRESSREQAVPADGAPLHRTIGSRGRETSSPLTDLFLAWRQSRLPDPPKKKKKKKKSGTKGGGGRCVSGIYTEAVRWRLCERGGTEVEAKRN